MIRERQEFSHFFFRFYISKIILQWDNITILEKLRFIGI